MNGIPKTSIIAPTLAPDIMANTPNKNPAKLFPPYPGMIFCGYQFQGKNPAYAPATTAASVITGHWPKSALNFHPKTAMVTAAITTNPGNCPSTPLLQPTMFCIATSHTKANKSDKTHTQCVPRHHLGHDRSITPPKGLVMYAIPIPDPITKSAARMFIPNRQYGEILSSYLSSRNPIIVNTAAPATTPQICLLPSENANTVRSAANMGIPPPRGTGCSCTTLGCLCFFGSSIIPKDLPFFTTHQVTIQDTAAAVKKAIILPAAQS